ncbi:MAG: hypothetical protein ACXWV6_00195 [Chitinophagaceae bacterium]
MKRSVLILFTAVILVNCTTTDNKEKTTIDYSIDNKHEKNTHEDVLSLNNGNKWKADVATNNNVKDLLGIIDEFNTGNNKTLISYQHTASALQKGLQKMIRECRMQGADHAALHKWLEPLMKHVSLFQKATTEEEAEEQFHTIHEQLNLYEKYFE